MNQRGNFHQNPYIGGSWGQSPIPGRGMHPGSGTPGFWGAGGPSPNRSFEHSSRGQPGHHSPSPHQSPMYMSPLMSQNPHHHHQQQRMHRRSGNNSPRYYHQYGGNNSGQGSFTPPRHNSQGQSRPFHSSNSNTDIKQYYKHSMVEDPWRHLTTTSTMITTT